MVSISVDSLVSRLKLERVNFIKIDCEGAEVEVLDGAMETLRHFQPTVVLEFNAHCLMNFGRINPPDALDRIMSAFPVVRRITRSEDGRIRLEAIDDRFQFMAQHVFDRHCGDDLFCSFVEPTEQF